MPQIRHGGIVWDVQISIPYVITLPAPGNKGETQCDKYLTAFRLKARKGAQGMAKLGGWELRLPGLSPGFDQIQGG